MSLGLKASWQIIRFLAVLLLFGNPRYDLWWLWAFLITYLLLEVCITVFFIFSAIKVSWAKFIRWQVQRELQRTVGWNFTPPHSQGNP